MVSDAVNDLRTEFWRFLFLKAGSTTYASDGTNIMVDLTVDYNHPNLSPAALVDMVSFMAYSEMFTALTHLYNLSIGGLSVTEVEVDFHNSTITIILGDQLPIKTIQTLEDELDRIAGVDFSILVEVQAPTTKGLF